MKVINASESVEAVFLKENEKNQQTIVRGISELNNRIKVPRKREIKNRLRINGTLVFSEVSQTLKWKLELLPT